MLKIRDRILMISNFLSANSFSNRKLNFLVVINTFLSNFSSLATTVQELLNFFFNFCIFQSKILNPKSLKFNLPFGLKILKIFFRTNFLRSFVLELSKNNIAFLYVLDISKHELGKKKIEIFEGIQYSSFTK